MTDETATALICAKRTSLPGAERTFQAVTYCGQLLSVNRTTEVSQYVTCSRCVDAMKAEGPMMVHCLHAGQVLCGFLGDTMPRDWPKGHAWLSMTEFDRGAPEVCPDCARLHLVHEQHRDAKDARELPLLALLTELLVIQEFNIYTVREAAAGGRWGPCIGDSWDHPMVQRYGDLTAEIKRRIAHPLQNDTLPADLAYFDFELLALDAAVLLGTVQGYNLVSGPPQAVEDEAAAELEAGMSRWLARARMKTPNDRVVRWARAIVRARNGSPPRGDHACGRCVAEHDWPTEAVKEDFVCAYHEASDVMAQQPVPPPADDLDVPF
jgi:hypothetical protein